MLLLLRRSWSGKNKKRRKECGKNVSFLFSSFLLRPKTTFFLYSVRRFMGGGGAAFSLSLCSIHEYGWNAEKKVSSMVFPHKNAVLKELGKCRSTIIVRKCHVTVEQKFELACEYFLTVLSLFPYGRDIFGYRKAFFFSIESGISKKRFLCRSMNRRRKNMHD